MPDVARILPPIPIHLADSPTIGGLVIPYIALRHRNGTACLGLVDQDRLAQCLRERRCGVCGQTMRERMVFLMRGSDLLRKCSVEPGLCPPCAAYTQKACPMVGGRMDHYRQTASSFPSRRCDDPRCPCQQWMPQSAPNRLGARAERWYALWATRYRLTHDDQGNLAAGFAGLRVLNLREV